MPRGVEPTWLISEVPITIFHTLARNQSDKKAAIGTHTLMCTSKLIDHQNQRLWNSLQRTRDKLYVYFFWDIWIPNKIVVSFSFIFGTSTEKKIAHVAMRCERDQSRILADEQQLQFFTFHDWGWRGRYMQFDYWLLIIDYWVVILSHSIQIVLIIDYWVDEQQVEFFTFYDLGWNGWYMQYSLLIIEYW